MPLRSEPSHGAEQMSQLLFGERATVLEVNNKDWARIACEWDGYEGWCRFSQLAVVTAKEYRKTAKYFSTGNAGKLVFENSEMWLPAGSELVRLKKGFITPVNKAGKFKGKKGVVKNVSLNGAAVKDAAMQYLHAPYQWGGRSIAGIDCSGLTQMVFKLCNKSIPRDASQQANEGTLVDFLQHANCGDLAFFDNAEGKIVHVAILLDGQTVIHATETAGRVVLDHIDPAGIISNTLKKRTHNLRFVKRIM